MRKGLGWSVCEASNLYFVFFKDFQLIEEGQSDLSKVLFC